MAQPCSAGATWPAKLAIIYIPLALALIGLGLVIVIEPSLIPGLTPPMM